MRPERVSKGGTCLSGAGSRGGREGERHMFLHPGAHARALPVNADRLPADGKLSLSRCRAGAALLHLDSSFSWEITCPGLPQGTVGSR